MRQTLRPDAAKTRPNPRVLFVRLLVLSFFRYGLFPTTALADNNTPARRDTASAQFDKAEEDRLALAARPENSRTVKDYAALVTEYKRVYLITPHAADVPAALNYVAELYRTMGDLFDAKYYQSAIDSYQFLLREYPTSRLRESALLAIAHMQEDDLHELVLAQNSYQQFLELHPHSTHTGGVRAILRKLNARTPNNIVPESSTAKNKTERHSPRAGDAENSLSDLDTKTDTKIGPGTRAESKIDTRTDTKLSAKIDPKTDTKSEVSSDASEMDVLGSKSIAHPYMERGHVHQDRD